MYACILEIGRGLFGQIPGSGSSNVSSTRQETFVEIAPLPLQNSSPIHRPKLY